VFNSSALKSWLDLVVSVLVLTSANEIFRIIQRYFLASRHGLAWPTWPPIPVKRILNEYCDFADPLFCSGLRWVQTMLVIEFTFYPAFCIAACASILRGVEGVSGGMAVAAVVFATVTSYSVVILAVESLFGDSGYKSPRPALWIIAYMPFMVIPSAFASRMWLRRCAFCSVRKIN
jgi:hypothetical protein